MNGCLLVYVLNGKTEERFVEETRKAVELAEEIAQKRCDVYIYAMKDGDRADDYWYSAIWGI